MRFLLFITALFIISCQNNAPKVAAINDTTQVQHTVAPTIDEQVNNLATYYESKFKMLDFILHNYPNALSQMKDNLFPDAYLAKVQPLDATLWDRMMQYNSFQKLYLQAKEDVKFRLSILPDTAAARVNKLLASYK